MGNNWNIVQGLLSDLVVCQMQFWTVVIASLILLTPRELVLTIAIFRAMLNPVINITIFGEIIKFRTLIS